MQYEPESSLKQTQTELSHKALLRAEGMPERLDPTSIRAARPGNDKTKRTWMCFGRQHLIRQRHQNVNMQANHTVSGCSRGNRKLTDEVVSLNGLHNSHVGTGLFLHVQVLHPSQLLPPSQVSNEQGICHPVGLHSIFMHVADACTMHNVVCTLCRHCTTPQYDVTCNCSM